MNRHCLTELAKRCKFFSSFIIRIAYWRSESFRVLRQSAESCKKSPRNNNWKLKTLQYCCALPNTLNFFLVKESTVFPFENKSICYFFNQCLLFFSNKYLLCQRQDFVTCMVDRNLWFHIFLNFPES